MTLRSLWPARSAGLAATQAVILVIVALLAFGAPAWGASAQPPIAGAGERAPGDVDCDGDVDSVDALKVLRHVANLPNPQPQGCPDIGGAPGGRLGHQGAIQGPGSMNAMSVDMALAGNSPTSVLSIQPCARLNANGRQDAEETGVDRLTFDVTAQGIPASHPMVGFNFFLEYDPGVLRITGADTALMLGAADGSQPFDVSDSLPDTDGEFKVSALDIGEPGTEESGSGVLARIEITAAEGAPAGTYPLNLAFNVHVSYTGDPNQPTAGFVPVVTNHGQISIDQPCAVSARHGDVDCDGDVDSVDALRILRAVAALPNELPPGCPPVS